MQQNFKKYDQEYFLNPVPTNKITSFFVHSTTRNAPYVHPRLDSILDHPAPRKSSRRPGNNLRHNMDVANT